MLFSTGVDHAGGRITVVFSTGVDHAGGRIFIVFIEDLPNM